MTTQQFLKLKKRIDAILQKIQDEGIRKWGICLGKFLMAEALKLAKKELRPKPKVFRLSVFASNKPAIGLYRKLGFKKVARIPKQLQYKGKLVDEIVMLRFK